MTREQFNRCDLQVSIADKAPLHTNQTSGIQSSTNRCCLPDVQLGRISNAEDADDLLMTRVIRGEQSALEVLIARHSKLLATVIFRIIQNQSEAEDVLMDVFCEAWSKASHYSTSKGKVLGWLVTMARCRAIDRLRKRESYVRATDRFEVEVKHNPQAWVSGRDPDGASERADIRSFIRSRLLKLPPFQREAIELAFFKGMSHREISLQTGIPIGTIKTRIELGLRKLSILLNVLSAADIGYAN